MALRRSAFATVLVALLVAMPAPALGAVSPTVIQSGLVNPWDVAVLPDGRMLVTERPGRLRIYRSVARGAPLLNTHTFTLIRAEGESGLMGIAVDRAFSSNRRIYVCASRQVSGLGWVNQVIAMTITSSNTVHLANYVIRTGMKAYRIHDGCAVEHGPDGKVWVSMGDVAEPWRAQNAGALNGKILRANPDGTVPSDNPVMPGRTSRSFVYSMGHRNPQGIAFQPGTNRLYAVEHGPDRDDEINRILAGRNYGWPCVTGPNRTYDWISGCSGKTFTTPAWSSGSPTLATSNAAFANGTNWGSWNGNLFVTTLKEQDLRRFTVNSTGTAFSQQPTLYNGWWGRLRAVAPGPSQSLLLTTSNGSDDKVVRLVPSQ